MSETYKPRLTITTAKALNDRIATLEADLAASLSQFEDYGRRTNDDMGYLRGEIARLEADLTAALALVEAGRLERERLRAALNWAALVAEQRSRPSSETYATIIEIARAALAPEEQRDV